MFVRELAGGGEIRARCLGNTWTLSIVNESGKGVAIGLTLVEAGALARLLTFTDDTGFSKEDTGVMTINGEQLEKENTP